jgi:hypothetical protein
VEEARLVGAIVSVRDAVRTQRAKDEREAERRASLIGCVADEVRTHYAELLADVDARIERRLMSVDPLRQTWNAFRMFAVEDDEVHWTQWFANLLRTSNGERCARVAWAAFCGAVADRAEAMPPTGESNPAGATEWRQAAQHVPLVEDEVRDLELGILDLLFSTRSMIAAVENKLEAHWHDGAKGLQADRYRKLAQKRLTGDARLGLVLLSQRKLVRTDYPQDYIHVSWADVGRAFREALRREWTDDQQCAIDLWPIIQTVVSIEQDLLGLTLNAHGLPKPSARLAAHNRLAAYLEGRD